ncbi:hypothetical protein [Blastopirellula retiformator]|uniref:Uncharacterized protein n=1 Tax=Blastopirellula retiformator TaxID=2527970 RepID=A0A5C5VKD1_9BACT|nr:hypothetical protein [Blastopirellula retiformator]TWT39066.1 hypothetical protein Enr8_07610 [Blastopirellula retiformator]
MSRFYRYVAIGGLCLTAILLVRLVWIAAHSNTSGELLSRQWRHATLGWFSPTPAPLSIQRPHNLGQFWTAEVERVLGDSPQDAQLAMGAALTLDNPPAESLDSDRLWLLDLPGLQVARDPEDTNWLDSRISFEQQCARPRGRLADAAIRLAPENVAWRRNRAMLLLYSDVVFSWDDRREENWKQVLEECADGDPDNALYDYVAAHFYWRASSFLHKSSLNAPTNTLDLSIHNEELFAEGIAYFERAQQKPFCAVDEVDFAAVEAFLDQTSLSRADQMAILSSRDNRDREIRLLWKLISIQQARAEQIAQAGDFATAAAEMHKCDRIVDQWRSVDAPTHMHSLSDAKYDNALRLLVIAASTSDPLAKMQLEEIKQATIDAYIDELLLDRAISNLTPATAPRGSWKSFSEELNSGAAILSGWLALAIVPLLLCALVSYMGARRFPRRELASIGPPVRFLPLLFLTCLTIIVFGIAPAQLISETVQTWVLLTAFVLLVLAFTAPGVWGFAFGRDSLLSRRGLTMIAAMILALVAVRGLAAYSPDSLRVWPPRLWIPSAVFSDLNRSVYQELEADDRYWQIVLIEWSFYRGPYLTLGIWLLLIGILAFLASKRVPANETTPATPAERAGATLRTLAHSTAGLALALGIAYLLMAPIAIQTSDQAYKRQRSLIAAGDPLVAQLPAEIAAITAAETPLAEKIIRDRLSLMIQETPQSIGDESMSDLEPSLDEMDE